MRVTVQMSFSPLQIGRHGLGGRVLPRHGANGQTAETDHRGENQKGGVHHRVERGNRRDGNHGIIVSEVFVDRPKRERTEKNHVGNN